LVSFWQCNSSSLSRFFLLIPLSFALPHLYSFSRAGTNTLVTQFPSLFTSPNKPHVFAVDLILASYFLGLGFSLSYLHSLSSLMFSKFPILPTYFLLKGPVLLPPPTTRILTPNPSRDFSLTQSLSKICLREKELERKRRERLYDCSGDGPMGRLYSSSHCIGKIQIWSEGLVQKVVFARYGINHRTKN
jgi:hypothetical protein